MERSCRTHAETSRRDPQRVAALSEMIHAELTQPAVIMEVCGGQTHTIMRFGLQQLLPPQLELIHGPGCPVCVTPVELIDQATVAVQNPRVILCSFGDMLRVPGTRRSLQGARARGGDVRIIYSPLDALEIAKREPEREVVMFAVGFETTAPANAMAVDLARRRGIENFSVLVSHVRVPPAIEAVLSARDNRVQAFLGPGHVCTVVGASEYVQLAQDYQVPIVISGFEPVDIMEGLLMVVRQLKRNVARAENQYTRAVPWAGNQRALEILSKVFATEDRCWRGLGSLPNSGWCLSEEYREYDAVERLGLRSVRGGEHKACMSGLILRGSKKPWDCPAFGGACTPTRPLGPTMVSSEGACAAYFAYARKPNIMRGSCSEAANSEDVNV